MSVRFSMGVVAQDVSPENESITPLLIEGDNLPLAAYSRFKYGDGSVATDYGKAMASLLLEIHPELLEEDVVHVTSSAYKVAPPAAHALLNPFVLQANAESALRGSRARFAPFKIYRETLTNGDYAGMSAAEREQVMANNHLSLPIGLGLEGESVVALDDICVTGSHEQVVERTLASSALRSLYHGYVLSVQGAPRNPMLEAAINSIVVKSMADIIMLSKTPDFILNARVCKYVLSQPLSDVADFCQQAPPAVVAQVCEYIKGDELDKMQKYRETYKGMIAMIVESEVDSLLATEVR
jgi:hypothetical protein